MPPSSNGSHSHGRGRWSKDALIGLASILVIAIIILWGVQSARGNDDYVCNDGSLSNQQQSACTDGSWSDWSGTNGAEQRTYTGTITLVSYAGGYLVSCSHPSPGDNGMGTGGTITTAYEACQIVETNTSGSADNGSGNNNNNNGNDNNGDNSGANDITSSETTGAVTNVTNTSGSYQDYQNYLNALLASSTLYVEPSLVQVGQSTQVFWTSSYVTGCTVAGSNGDAWAALQSPVQGETSKPIEAQTTFTLQGCTNSLGTVLPAQSAVVNVIPTFNEQ